MGEAKSRTKQYEQTKQSLLASCDGDAKVVAGSAIKLFERFILPKHYTRGCYLVTMVLHRFLAEEHGIATIPVVGYVNDGTDDIMISHAWLEFDAMKTDLTLNVVEHPDVIRPGDVVVLDTVLRPGVLHYSYHRERPAEAIAVVNRMLSDPASANIARHKEIEHEAMLVRSRDASLMDAYIAGAPLDCGYAAMTAVLR
ncbi:hypothetical protein [uncultured Pleomorphomonas sp.]|uniref:hypothetical protein n=1 Tax=uncultured Pleomorphomonas sp. TaxID=442121 RepID=UPI002590B1E2|nr:hypothetical protein [uncultured Pleomorphomonas sp.]